MRRLTLAVALTSVISLVVSTGGAQAVVVDMSSVGQASVAYNSSNRGGYVGVELVPGTRGNLASATPSIPTVTSSAPCLDPALPSDLFLPNNGLCSHGG